MHPHPQTNPESRTPTKVLQITPKFLRWCKHHLFLSSSTSKRPKTSEQASPSHHPSSDVPPKRVPSKRAPPKHAYDPLLPKFPHFILQTIALSALAGEEECQKYIWYVHSEIESPNIRPSQCRFSCGERLLMRKAHCVLDLELLCLTQFTTAEVVTAVKVRFFGNGAYAEGQQEGEREVRPLIPFKMLIHDAVETGALPAVVGTQILLLATADELADESEVEKAALDGRRDALTCEDENVLTCGLQEANTFHSFSSLKGSETAHNRSNDCLDPHHRTVSLAELVRLDNLATPADLADAPAPLDQTHIRLEIAMRELQECLNGD